MVESEGNFPFRKLENDKYLTLDVMMHIEHQYVLKFMCTVNQRSRAFLTQNFITIKNGFTNEGLIPYNFNVHSYDSFYHYE
jgi:hypothetical protein